jgi:thiol-disulfide isomerase/thioredoxin
VSSSNGGVKPSEYNPGIMSLETMEPNPVWTEGAYAETVDILAAHADELVYKVWGGDWCKDCRSQLPDFGAALDAAEVPTESIEHYAVEKEDDGSKVGPKVEEYGIELIPTVVVERDGEEIARFVEEESVPIAVYLAQEIRDAKLD